MSSEFYLAEKLALRNSGEARYHPEISKEYSLRK